MQTIMASEAQPGDVVVDVTQWKWTLQVLDDTTEPKSPTGERGFFCPGVPTAQKVSDSDILQLVVRNGQPV